MVLMPIRTATKEHEGGSSSQPDMDDFTHTERNVALWGKFLSKYLKSVVLLTLFEPGNSRNISW